MPVPFLCQICPSYGYDYTHIESDFARLSYRYDNHLLDLFWIFFWIIGGRSLIDMTADRFRIDMIMTVHFGIENTLDLTVNPRPKTLNLLSFQSDRRFVKKTLLKSI